MISFWKLFILLALFLPTGIEACHAQFQKELRYLDLYLGIKPDNNGDIPVEEAVKFATYIESPDELNCDFETECLWRNAPTDNLLDTSDWWYFKKNDEKTFPVQIQPGNPKIPKGEHFIIAGNTTKTANGAVLSSAPVACQKGFANLTFSFWLYNNAQVEVVILRAMNRRRHLQVLMRPKMKCDFLGAANEECRVEIPPIKEPFRIGIRAFDLKDNTVGSLAIIDHIRYHGKICQQSPFPSSFSSLRIPPYDNSPLVRMSDLSCERPLRSCRWGNAAKSQLSEWRVGRSIDRWVDMFEITANQSHPNSSFLFLAVDSFSPRPYSSLTSQVIPCSQRTTSLSLKYWMKTGTQAEICAVDEDGIALSCAYLEPNDSPGPITIDLDSYSQPFKFTVGIIAFDENSFGLLAISELRVAGLLCSEPAPPIVTTISPPTIQHIFGLQPGNGRYVPYDLSLNCDFTKDYCSQWVNYDGIVKYGVMPRDSDVFPVPKGIKGNVAVFMMQNATVSELRSRMVPCSINGRIDVEYMRSEDAQVRICALEQCVDGNQTNGIVSIGVSSTTPFYVTIETSSRDNAVVIISKVSTSGEFCPLKTAEQTVCDQLVCDFKHTFCSYETIVEKPGDVPVLKTGNGASVTLNGGGIRAVLVSPTFDLAYPSILTITLSQSTFGSRVLLCPDVTSDPTLCHELSGPRVLDSSDKQVMFPLDIGARSFSLVLLHDKSIEFGPATFNIKSMHLRTVNDEEMCF
ncbi:hypothetical protein L3Y34_004720 [Caenorhabditis briggsae]|uniref:MAM domain-containing protein n=1 Tax=Caenorhabditis briggsae TaxID=6238 RepID=A0AAE9D774_CAEBR|nr:hypothetical protein L3Y34_004720 [Caenorhabditis briggsae]